MKIQISILAIASIITLNAIAVDYPIVLERSTPEEVAKTFTKDTATQLENCFRAYKKKHNPNAKFITYNVIEQLEDNYPPHGGPATGYCYQSDKVAQVALALFKQKDRQRVLPSDLKDWIFPWSLAQISPAAGESGFVDSVKLPTLFYYAFEKTRDQNAIRRFRNPSGLKLKKLLNHWSKVGMSLSYDKDFLNPVVVSPTALDNARIFETMRNAFPYFHRVDFISAKQQAITDFWNASGGPDGDPVFKYIAEQLRKDSITKRFYFQAGGREWVRNILIVVDEHNQMWGFMMGYTP